MHSVSAGPTCDEEAAVSGHFRHTMVDFNVRGKNAVVTGGTRGLGLYCAEALVRGGARAVFITSRKVDACRAAERHLEAEAEALGNAARVFSFAADLADEAQCVAFHAFVAERADKIHVLVANAGATWGAPLETHPLSAVKKVLNLNVISVFHCVQLFVPLLEEAGTEHDPARVVIMSSIAATVTNESHGTFGYLASKAAVSHLSQNLAVHLGRRGINVNAMAPGFVPTKMTRGLLELAGNELNSTNPRGRYGTKQDIQSALLFLCAPQSAYINGIVLPVDGGARLNPPAFHL